MKAKASKISQEQIGLGAMEVCEWVQYQARNHLPVYQMGRNAVGRRQSLEIKKRDEMERANVELLDTFSALYGLDPRAAEVGRFGDRSSELLDIVQGMPEFDGLQSAADARPWACALSARRIHAAALEVLRRQQERRKEQGQGQDGPDSQDGDGQGEQEGSQEGKGKGKSKGKGKPRKGKGKGDQGERGEQEKQGDSGETEASTDAGKGSGMSEAEREELREALAEAIKGADEEISDIDEAVEGVGGRKAGTDAAHGSSIGDIARVMIDDPKLRKVAKIAGAMARAGRASARRKRAKGSAETVDVREGGLDEIADALPMELLGLIDPDFEAMLDRQLCEGSIQVEHKIGSPEERGPVVVVVDESGSMDGDRDVWAKGVALGIFARCRAERRPFAVVRFSTSTRLHEFRTPAAAKFEELRKWTSEFLNGGTEIGRGLKVAAEFIRQSRAFKRADIVLITDGESGDNYGQVVQDLRNAGVDTHGIGIGMQISCRELATNVTLSDAELETIYKSAKKIDAAISV